MATSAPPPLEIFCINLDHRTDRWSHIQTEIKNTPLETLVTRFSGIKAEIGVVGCRESHFAVIRKAKELGLPWVGVMEDDCAFYPHFASEFPNVITSLWKHRDTWDIFNSGPIDIQCALRVEKQLLSIGNCTCLQFIIINSSAYDKILNSYVMGISEGGVDLYYRDVCANRIFTWTPPLTYQIVSKSDVQTNYTIGETDEFQKAYAKVLMFKV
jgi:hypothetical protein